MFTSPLGGSLSPGDAVLLPVVFLIGTLLCSVPVMLLIRRSPKQGLTGAIQDTAPGAAVFADLFYALFFLFGAMLTTARFSVFIGTVLFRDSPTAPLTALLLLAAALAASEGTEALGRTCGILFAVTGVSVAVSALTLTGKTDMANLTPPLYNGVGPLLNAGLDSVSRTYEIAAAGLLVNVTNGKKKHVLIWALTAFSAAAFLLFLLTAAVTGSFGIRQTFPLYTLIACAGTDFSERLDAAVTGLWVFSVFVKDALFLRLAADRIGNAVKKPLRPYAFYIASAAVFLPTALLFPTSDRFFAFAGSKIPTAVFLTGTVLLPLFILLIPPKQRTGKNGGMT